MEDVIGLLYCKPSIAYSVVKNIHTSIRLKSYKRCTIQYFTCGLIAERPSIKFVIIFLSKEVSTLSMAPSRKLHRDSVLASILMLRRPYRALEIAWESKSILKIIKKYNFKSILYKLFITL